MPMSSKKYRILFVGSDKELASKLEVLLKEIDSLEVFFHWARTSREGLQYVSDFLTDVVFVDPSLTKARTAHYIDLLKRSLSSSALFLALGNANSTKSIARLLEMGFHTVLFKKDLHPVLLGHVLRMSEARRTLAERNDQQRQVNEDALQAMLPELCNQVPIGVWEFDFSTNRLKVSRILQAVLQLHQSIYALPLSDFLRFIHPEDREAVRLFFLRPMPEKNRFLFYRWVLDENRTKKMLLLSSEFSGKQEGVRYGIQMELPTFRQDQVPNNQLISLSEWFLSHALDVLKQMSGSASLPIFKQITAIQQGKYMMENSFMKEFKNISTLVDIYVTTTNDLMSHYVLQRGIPETPSLPFVIDDLASLLESYFERKAENASLNLRIQKRGDTSVKIIAQPGLIGFLFYNMIKGAVKLAQPNTSAFFKHFHEKSGGVMICDFILQVKGSSICKENQKLLKAIKTLAELEFLKIEEQAQSMALTSIAIGIVGLRKTGAKIQLNFNDRGRMIIKVRLYAPVFLSDAGKSETLCFNPERILLWEPYAPHQLLVQNKLIQIFPHAVVDTFSHFEEVMERLENVSYSMLLFYHQAMFQQEVKAWLARRQQEAPPLIFLAALSDEESSRPMEKYNNVYLFPKKFGAKEFAKVFSPQAVE